MVNRMSFESLVNTFAVPIKIKLPKDEAGGEYVNGEWVPAFQGEFEATGAVIPYSDRAIFQSAGQITSKDRQLAYLGELPIGTKVIDKDVEYEITSTSPYMDHYADTNLYDMKEVGLFGKSI